MTYTYKSLESAIYEIEKTLGYAPDNIILDGDFHRFKTQKNIDGAYVGNTWDFEGKSYYTIHYTDYHSTDQWFSIESWDKNATSYKDNEYFKTVYKQNIEQINKNKEENYKIVATNSHKTLLEYTKFNEFISHPYLVNKKIENIKTISNILLSDDNKIVVPYFDINEYCYGYQTINENGEKRFLPGSKKKGCFHMIGNYIENTPIIFIGEGFATMASVYLATQQPCFVTFDAYNLKHTARLIIKKVREIAPECLLVVIADDDRYNPNGNIGINCAHKAISNIIGAFYVSPFFSDYTYDTYDKQANDFNDLHIYETLHQVQAQLNMNYLLQKAKSRLYNNGNQTLSIAFKGKKKDAEESYSLRKAEVVANFQMNFLYQARKENDPQKNLIRFVEIKNPYTHVINIELPVKVCQSLTEFKSWIRTKGNQLIFYDGFNLDKFFNTLDLVLVPDVEFKNKFGKQSNGSFVFKNICIEKNTKKNKIETYTANKFDYFEMNFDKTGRPVGVGLIKDLLPIAPSLKNDLSKLETDELVACLLNDLEEAYTNMSGILSVGYVVATLFCDQFMNKQFPILNLYGEPQSGKSNLIHLLEYIHGFNPMQHISAGINADSTIAQIERILLRSRNLITTIKEVKPDKIEAIQKIVQGAYDGEIRQKLKRDSNNDWVGDYQYVESGLVIDSNHSFYMPSVLERIIPIEFKRKDFNVKSAQKINYYIENLSAITYWLLLNNNFETIYAKQKKHIESLLKAHDIPNTNTRLANMLIIIKTGINILFDTFQQDKYKDIKEMNNTIDKFLIDSIIPNLKDMQTINRIDDQFFRWALFLYAESIHSRERNMLISDKTPTYFIKHETNHLVLSSAFYTQARLQYSKEYKIAEIDLKTALNSSEYINQSNVPVYWRSHHASKRSMYITLPEEMMSLLMDMKISHDEIE